MSPDLRLLWSRMAAFAEHVEVRHALMLKAVDLFVGGPTRDWSAELKRLYDGRRAAGDSLKRAEDAKRIIGTRPSLALSKYAGSYERPLLGRFDVTESGGKLRITTGPHYAGELEHWQYDTFRIHYDKRWQGTDQIRFTIGDEIPSALNIAGFSLSRVTGRAESANH